MEGNYPVSMRGNPVGSVTVRKQGLYYHILCCCDIPDGEVCRLMLRCEHNTHKIGVLIPGKTGFTLEKRIPVKNLSIKEPEFFIAPQQDLENRIFVPIRAEEPFAYLSRLNDAFLGYQDDKIGVWITK